MHQSVTCSKSLARIEEWAEARELEFRHDGQSGFGAVFSPCGHYRYLLWRLPSPRAAVLGMGMLNPSTADEHADDRDGDQNLEQGEALAQTAGRCFLDGGHG